VARHDKRYDQSNEDTEISVPGSQGSQIESIKRQGMSSSLFYSWSSGNKCEVNTNLILVVGTNFGVRFNELS